MSPFIELKTDTRRQLRKALTASFSDYSKLKIFVSDNFEEFRLDEIAESKATKKAAENLIEACEEEGLVEELIVALYRDRPRNLEVQQLQKTLKDYFDQRVCLESEQPVGDELSFQLPAQYADLNFESFLAPPLSYEADVGKLKRGLQLSNAVCRIVFEDRPTTGTGVLIAPDLVLTNYHVLSREKLEGRSPLCKKAQTLLCEFGWISDNSQSPIRPDAFALDTDAPVVAFSPPSELDYVLLRLDSAVKQCQYLQPVSIPQQPIDLKPKEALNILQHPAGETMQISLSASGLVGMDQARHRLWYVNRTQNGSSGSPCFNENWECIALHHASISRGFGSIREGILISSILSEIQQHLDEV